MNEAEFLELTQKPEGPTLDFKRDQYKLELEHHKSEFIKDILSMANTIRNCTSFIVIGVKAFPDGKKDLKGVASHWDDANLQSIIKDKVEKVPPFQYFPISIDDRTYGIIEIPVSYDKPFRVSRDFGVINKHAIYIRRGTMNDDARDKEIDAMYEERKSTENVFLSDIISQPGTSNGNSNLQKTFDVEELKSKTCMPNYVLWEAVFTNNGFEGYDISEMYPKYSKCFLTDGKYPKNYFPFVLNPIFKKTNYPEMVFESNDYAGKYSNVFVYDKIILKNNEVIYSSIELTDNNPMLALTRLPNQSLIYLIFVLKNLYEHEMIPLNIDFLLKIKSSGKVSLNLQNALFKAESNMFEEYFLKDKECELKMNFANLDIKETCRLFRKIYSLFVSENSHSIDPFLTLDTKDFEHVYKMIDSGQFE